MKITPALKKAITETKYLSVDNHARYRLIMRLFYINHEQINYWLNVNDIYGEVKNHIDGYTVEDCKQDLENLVEWGNLINDLDTDNISKLQEFKNKKFRYQMSDYSVEIERLTITLEGMNVEGSSLDIGLIGAIRVQIEQFHKMEDRENTELYSWWRALTENFTRLNREYQDYMKCFSFLKREDSTTAKQFIVMKDDIIRYLRSFVKGIQKNGTVIAQELEDCENIKDEVLERIIDYEISVPRLNANVTRSDITDEIYSKYNNLYRWFTQSDDTGMEHIMRVTNSVIRSLTGYAAILAENVNSMASRREEYKLFAKKFMDCESVEDAHRLSALLFGLTNTCHIATDTERNTESISSGIFDEPPTELVIKPRVVTYREKQKQSAIPDKTEKKKRLVEEHIKRVEQSKQRIEKLIKNGRIIMEQLPQIDAETRTILLSWISSAQSRENKDDFFMTEYGFEFRLTEPKDNRKIILKCDDGELIMPAFVLDFGGNL